MADRHDHDAFQNGLYRRDERREDAPGGGGVGVLEAAAPPPDERRLHRDRPRPGSLERRERPEDRSTPATRRAREMLRRYRQPVIGLSLLGVAAPLVNAVVPETAAETAAREDAVLSGEAREEALAADIAVTRAEGERNAAVLAAVERYDIDQTLAKSIYDTAVEEGIDTRVAFGLVRTESTFDTRAKSWAGALGLTQLLPSTARWLVPGTSASDLYEPETNLRVGFKYLNYLIDKYRGNTELALLAYNRGPGTVDKVLKRGGDPDNGYAAKVLNE